MRVYVLLGLLLSCGGAGGVEAPSAIPPPAPTSTARATPTASAAPALPSGGSVLIGEIPAAKHFDPKQAIEDSKPALLECYNRARASAPGLSGKLKMRIVINEAGSAIAAEPEPGGSANTPALAACVGEALKAVTFPKPGGSATVVAPLVFRPE